MKWTNPDNVFPETLRLPVLHADDARDAIGCVGSGEGLLVKRVATAWIYPGRPICARCKGEALAT
jgi:hypothetical protein